MQAAGRERVIVRNRINLKDFIYKIEIIEIGLKKYLFICNKLCIKFYTFVGIIMQEDQITCRFCEVDLLKEGNIYKNIVDHIQTPRHVDLLKNSIVIITSIDDEFIRQIRPNLYDCCYCGITESTEEGILEHLNTDEHQNRKIELQKMSLWRNVQPPYLFQTIISQDIHSTVSSFIATMSALNLKEFAS